MRYRQIGATGVSVSVIGFGAWGIGGYISGGLGYGPTNDAVSRQALAAAFDHGITFYDTAPLYGEGHSESLIGEVFAHRRDKVVIATKTGYRDFRSGADFTPAGIRRSLEGSLRRLGTDYVDLLQLHDAAPAYLNQHPEVMQTLNDLRQEGKVRIVAASVKHPADGSAMIEEHGLKAIQVNLSMMDQRAVNIGLLTAAKHSGASVIARTPLNFGFLTGAMTGDESFRLEDHRSRWPREQIRQWSETGRCLLAAAGWRPGESGASYALRYTLSLPAVAVSIPGIMTPQEALENAACGDADAFPDDRMRAIAQICSETTVSDIELALRQTA